MNTKIIRSEATANIELGRTFIAAATWTAPSRSKRSTVARSWFVQLFGL